MTEAYSNRVHNQHVVLDIGGTVGALLLYTDPDLDNAEIELSPRGEPGARFHNQVHERRFNGQSLYAAVYPHIEAGTYDIWDADSHVVDTVTIVGGEVATVDWRGRHVHVHTSAPHHHP